MEDLTNPEHNPLVRDADQDPIAQDAFTEETSLQGYDIGELVASRRHARAAVASAALSGVMQEVSSFLPVEG